MISMHIEHCKLLSISASPSVCFFGFLIAVGSSFEIDFAKVISATRFKLGTVADILLLGPGLSETGGVSSLPCLFESAAGDAKINQ